LKYVNEEKLEELRRIGGDWPQCWINSCPMQLGKRTGWARASKATKGQKPIDGKKISPKTENKRRDIHIYSKKQVHMSGAKTQSAKAIGPKLPSTGKDEAPQPKGRE